MIVICIYVFCDQSYVNDIIPYSLHFFTDMNQDLRLVLFDFSSTCSVVTSMSLHYRLLILTGYITLIKTTTYRLVPVNLLSTDRREQTCVISATGATLQELLVTNLNDVAGSKQKITCRNRVYCLQLLKSCQLQFEIVTNVEQSSVNQTVNQIGSCNWQRSKYATIFTPQIMT